MTVDGGGSIEAPARRRAAGAYLRTGPPAARPAADPDPATFPADLA
jgi:hypothetical protein